MKYLKHFAVMFLIGILGSGLYGAMITGVGGSIVMWVFGAPGIVLSALLAAAYCRDLEKRR